MIQLEQNEHVICEGRKHVFVFLSEIFVFFLGSIVPYVLYEALTRFFSIEIPEKIFYLLLFAYFIFLLFAWIFAFLAWTDHSLDAWIVTNKRLIDIEQKGMFSRDVSSVHLDKIQDIKIIVTGLIPTLLKFGDVHVQTAAVTKEFVLKHAKDPEKLKQAITDALHKKLEEIKTVRIEEVRTQ